MEEQKKQSQNNWVVAISLLAVVLSLSAAVYFWNDARSANEQSPEAVAAKNLAETERVVGELGEILLLDNEQDPTVARVEDPSVLQQSNPDFYENIQVDDYLILFPSRAIIYRSSETRIINIAPIVNTQQLQQQEQDQATQPAAESSESN